MGMADILVIVLLFAGSFGIPFVVLLYCKSLLTHYFKKVADLEARLQALHSNANLSTSAIDQRLDPFATNDLVQSNGYYIASLSASIACLLMTFGCVAVALSRGDNIQIGLSFVQGVVVSIMPILFFRQYNLARERAKETQIAYYSRLDSEQINKMEQRNLELEKAQQQIEKISDPKAKRDFEKKLINELISGG